MFNSIATSRCVQFSAPYAFGKDINDQIQVRYSNVQNMSPIPRSLPVQLLEGMSSRKRKPNWTEQECLLLAQLLQERKEAIRGKCGIEVSIQDKRQAWKQVAQSINNVFPQIHRTVYDCNKKWENLLAKSKVEIKRQKRQAGTGEENALC